MSLTTERALQSILNDRDRVELEEIAGEHARFDEPLAPYTSWRIGGPADVLIAVESEDELAALLDWCRRRRRPWFVLGSGSNVLVGDGGMRGVVLRLGGSFAEIRVRADDGEVVVEAGASAPMATLTARCAGAGARSIGSLAGIPGTVGGSLRMNAGTDREIGDFVRHVWVQSPAKPQPHPVSVHYFYRHTTLARDAVVSRVTLAFERDAPERVREEMHSRLVRRKNTQPIALPNAGSCFRNPPGDKAARLIESVGAKGWREGDAQISPQHANFISNLGNASAKDVASLLARVRDAVAAQCGVQLQLEVHLVGVFVDV
jgi:UDP-N-acetylmuramate dehydrogenase